MHMIKFLVYIHMLLIENNRLNYIILLYYIPTEKLLKKWLTNDY